MGFGKSCSEGAIIDECKVLVDNIKENIRGVEDEIYLDKNLNCAALNIIWNLVAGQRFLYEDQKMKDLVKFVGKYAFGITVYRLIKLFFGGLDMRGGDKLLGNSSDT